MSAVGIMWSSSPSSLGRPSSPLNPHTHPQSIGQPGSSSPVTSPTPQHASLTEFPLGTPTLQRRTSPQQTRPASLRRPRPANRRPSAGPGPGPGGGGGGGGGGGRGGQAQMPVSPMGLDLFSAEGTTPVESAMWKERFARRIKDRERRQSARQQDLDRRRSVESSDGDDMDEEQAYRQAQQDDEEIFRRLVVLQKRREEHQNMVSYEIETGGSDPLLPEFWQEELDALEREERNLSNQLGPQRARYISAHTQAKAYAQAQKLPSPAEMQEQDDLMVTPTRHGVFPGARPSPQLDPLDEEDEWAREAAEAEQAEREAEESEVAARVEQAYGLCFPVQANAQNFDMDWGAFDAMDIE